MASALLAHSRHILTHEGCTTQSVQVRQKFQSPRASLTPAMRRPDAVPGPVRAAARTLGSTASVGLGQFKAHSLWFRSNCHPGAAWPNRGLVSLWAKVLERVVSL